MDERFLAGLVIGAIVGAAWALAVVAWRKWRGTVAAVPVTRAEAFASLRHVVVLVLVCGAAACAALGVG